MKDLASASTPTLLPISISYDGQTADLSVPAEVPLAELLPGLAHALGRLDTLAASEGYAVFTATGQLLTQENSLRAQKVAAGDLLTLQPLANAAREQRYDDLVEVVSKSVEKDQAPWQRGHSLQLSAHTAALLIAIAALLVASDRTHPAAAAAVGIVGALLVVLTAAVVARVPSRAGALSLIHTVPLLLGSAAATIGSDQWDHAALLAAGAGITLGALGVLSLPSDLHASLWGPVTAGVSISVFAALNKFGGVSSMAAAAGVFAFLILLTLAAPWVAMARFPVRVTPDTADDALDADVIAAKVAASHMFVIAVKLGACLTLLFLAPFLTGSLTAIALLACTGLSLMLTTRFLRSRLEVLIGVITGMVLTVGTTLALAFLQPDWVPLVGGGVLLAAILLLVTNVVNARLRPTLTRIADACGALALLAIMPLTALLWGVI